MMWLTSLFLVGLLVLTPMVQAQTIFEHARGETPVTAGYTTNPDFVRGSVHFLPLLPPPSTTVFRGGFETGDFCNFDAAASITHMVETLPELLLQWLPLIAIGIGISFACKTFPSECDLVKDIKNFANVMLRFQTASCNDVVQRAMFDGVASRNDAIGACFRDAPPEEPSNITWERCFNDPGGIPLPNGGRATEVPIIAAVLESAGVDPEAATRIQGYTGRFILRASGSIFSSDKETPSEASLARFAELLDDRIETVAEVVSALEDGGVPGEGELRSISVPGLPTPVAALRRIADEPDPEVKAYKIAHVASAIAFAQAEWDMLQDLGTFQKASVASNVTPSQRQVLDQALANFKQELERFRKLKTVLDQHVAPVFAQLLEERAQQLAEANASTVSVQPDVSTANRYGAQTAFGYTQ
jgi:hypothetical protein